MTTIGEWIRLFRNEGDAYPYVVAQKTSLFMPDISPNLVVFIEFKFFAWGLIPFTLTLV